MSQLDIAVPHGVSTDRIHQSMADMPLLYCTLSLQAFDLGYQEIQLQVWGKVSS